MQEIDEQIEAEMESGIIADPAAEMDPAMAAGDEVAAPEAGGQEPPAVEPSDARRGEF